MKKTICTCDLCGKPIENNDRKYVRYKVKINKSFRHLVHGSNYITYDESRRWYEIDCHKECVDKLFGFIISPELEEPKPPYLCERKKSISRVEDDQNVFAMRCLAKNVGYDSMNK